MSTKPVIGLTSSCDKHIYIGKADELAVITAGGIPLLLPIHIGKEEAEKLISLCDGILFTGGEDVNPQLYGENIIPQCGEVNDDRDTVEKYYFEYAVENKMPILGICRGHQAINVYMGGSLYQDIPSQYKTNVNVQHRSPNKADTLMHTVLLEKGSLMEKIAGANEISVTSTHHQAVKEVAKGLKATAFAPDGTIEALEGDNILSVQFHPELRFDKENHALNLFKHLVNEAIKYSEKPSE